MSKKTKTEEVPVQQDADVEFAFLVVRTVDGQTQIQPAGEDVKPQTIDDVRNALALLVRNIDAEHQAQMIHTVMVSAASQMQAMQGGDVRTQGGVVIPGKK